MPYPLRPKCLDVSNRLKLSVPGQECGAQLSGALEVVPMQVDRRGRDRGMAQVVAHGDELGTTAEGKVFPVGNPLEVSANEDFFDHGLCRPEKSAHPC